MENIKKILKEIEQKIIKIIQINQNLTKENLILKEENNNLIKQLNEQNIKIKQLNETINNLKISKFLELAGKNNKKEIKNKISELVREIDKCITLLNE